jgi:hypothetical protein
MADLARRIVQVPKAEVDERAKAYARKKRKAAPSGRLERKTS